MAVKGSNLVAAPELLMVFHVIKVQTELSLSKRSIHVELKFRLIRNSSPRIRSLQNKTSKKCQTVYKIRASYSRMIKFFLPLTVRTTDIKNRCDIYG